MSQRPKTRCAIYTRKSSDEGLDQEFNSLDAQHEACAAYIASQRHEGWKLLPGRYDDGGLSEGTLERPALQRLLEEVDAGRIDMVVVYKIDRLTRSLADFARLVERLEHANCSFVSVTQAFNTSSSMGRLTLNVLLSFAQFEREVTAERIRDKIAASKKKGLWMGGNLPLGYDRHPDPKARTLMVNEDEAKTVRRLFDLYAEMGCLSQVAEVAARDRLRSKRIARPDGSSKGGHILARGQIYYLLRNPVYLGRIRHKDKVWPGQHPAIVSEERWNRVQDLMRQASRRSRGQSLPGAQSRATDPGAWLTGLLRDDTGDRLTPTHTTLKGRRLRYYVSNRLISGGPDPSGWRLPGPALEKAVTRILASHLDTAARTHAILIQPDAEASTAAAHHLCNLAARLSDAGGAECSGLIQSGALRRGQIEIHMDGREMARSLRVPVDDLHPSLLHVSGPFNLRRRGVETKIIAGDITPAPVTHLRAMLIRAHGWARELQTGTNLTDIARRENHSDAFIRTRTQLAFLSPKIQAAILDGSQPPELSLKRLVSVNHPLDWHEQEKTFGFF